MNIVAQPIPDHIRQWHSETKECILNFHKWAGFDTHSYNAAIVVWMGWVTQDPKLIARVTSIPLDDVEYFADRANKFHIWSGGQYLSACDWPGLKEDCEKDERIAMEANLSFLCDCMTVAGFMDRKINEDKVAEYQVSHPFMRNDKVKPTSGKGRWWYVCEVKNGKNGPMVKLGSKPNMKSGNGPWRSAKNYELVARRQKLEPARSLLSPLVSHPSLASQERT